MAMPNINFLGTAIDKIKGFWSSINLNQRMLIMGLAALITAIFVGFILWLNQPTYKILYTNLAQEDANKIVSLLQTEKVGYKLEDEGKTITVPADKVYDLRLKVAGEGNLVGSGIGFEIFDEVKMGQTEFVQRINYQRALQGELARTLAELPNVESARVHLVVPQRSLFIEEQQSPSASVVLRLKDKNVKMTPKEVEGVVNLLTMSVEGLTKASVSITDSTGKPIYTPEDEGLGANNSQLEYRIRFESILERRIDELLTPVLGPGKAIAKVNAQLDYSQRTIRRETYDPDGQVVRSEQRSEEEQHGRANLESGSPDANFRGDGLANSISTQEGTRESRTTNYEINRVEENIIGQMGEINRLTIAVAVDGSYIKDENQGYTYVPRTAEELARIKELVAGAIGYDRARGDTIEVTNIAFGDSEIPYEPSAAELLSEFANRMAKPLLSALLAFLFIMLVVRPIVMSVIRPRVESGEMLEGLEGLPAAEEQYALYEAQEQAAKQSEEQSRMAQQAMQEATVFSLEGSLSLDDIKARALQLAERNMDQTITIVRGWMSDAKVRV